MAATRDLAEPRCRLSWHIAATALVVMSLAACSPRITRHGNLVSEADLQQVQPGMSQEEIKLSLGTPDTTSTVGGGAYYYISTTKKSVSFFKPETIDRRVTAVYFDQFGSVERVASYGLKDGKVIDHISRETPPQAGEKSLLGQIFRGIGKNQIASTDDP